MPFWKRKSTSSAPPPAPAQAAPQSQWQATIPTRPGGQTQQAPLAVAQPNLFQQRGEEFFNSADYGNAVFMYREALRQAQSNNEQLPILLQLALAQTLCSPPDLDGALTSAVSAIAINPSSGPAWRLKGDIHAQLNDNAEAVNSYSKALPLLSGYDKVQTSQSLASSRAKAGGAAPSVHTPTSPGQAYPEPARQSFLQPGSPSQLNHNVGAAAPNITYTAPPPQTPVARRPVSTTSPAGTNPIPGSSTSPLLNVQPPIQQRSPSPNSLAQGQSLANQFDIPNEAPPSYNSTGPSVTRVNAAAGLMNSAAFTSWETWMSVVKTGGLYLKGVTTAGEIDTIVALFWGKNFVQSILLDVPPTTIPHQSWTKYYATSASYPGTTFLDYDCETSSSYDGYHPGTITIIGYSEEYRIYQLDVKPALQLHLESQTFPPLMEMDAIVERLDLLQKNPTMEDNAGLWRILGLTAAPNATTVTCIQDICMSLHRGQYDAPNRFPNFLNTASFSQHVFGATTGVGFRNFLLNILIGAELTIRLDKMGSAKKYPNFMSNSISAVALLARLWMVNITLRKNPTTGNYIVNCVNWALQEEGLIRFAEEIGWPYLDEARQNITGMFNKMATHPDEVPNYLSDWLHGLVLPGKFFRQRIMSCLVMACPSTKSLSSAPFFGNGVVAGGKSYWPKRTALGRVLAGMTNMRIKVGWVGPVAAPAGTADGWYHLDAKELNFVKPVVDDLTKSSIEILGFTEGEVQRDPEGTIRDMTDREKWHPPTSIPRRVDAEKASLRKAVLLDAVRLIAADRIANVQYHRAAVDFTCHGKKVSYTLYTNPVFVSVPKCEGRDHPIHERVVQKYFNNIVQVKKLKDGSTLLPPRDTLMIIDATEPDEEAVARAWCAETGRHAVVRKNGVGCFTCATSLATQRTGLGFNVLIWVS